MKPGNDTIVADLQDAAQILVHIKLQFKSDAKQLKRSGPKWLANKFKSWASDAAKHLDNVLSQIVAFGADPDYECGKVEGADSIDAFLTRAESLLTAAHDTFCDFRKAAWDVRADYVPDIYEHAIHDLADDIVAVETELDLLEKLGDPGYTGARLEDEA